MTSQARPSAHFDHDPDLVRFKRQHTGDAPDPLPPIRPLWPAGAGGLALLGIGAQMIVAAPTALVALCGLIVCGGGLALIGWLGASLAHGLERE